MPLLFLSPLLSYIPALFSLFFFSLPSYSSSSSSPSLPLCITNCSAIFKHTLTSIIGHNNLHSSPAMAMSPLHALIMASPNNIVVQRKSEWICNSVLKFKQCAKGCEENRLKLVELANIAHWDIICDALSAQPKAFSEFVTCQRNHLEQVQRSCPPSPGLEDTVDGHRQTLAGFCRQMKAYTRCYERTPQKCSRNAKKINSVMIQVIRNSIARIQHIARGHLRIPDSCRLSAEAEREEEEEAENPAPEDYWTHKEDEEKLREEEKSTHGPTTMGAPLRPTLPILTFIVLSLLTAALC